MQKSIVSNHQTEKNKAFPRRRRVRRWTRRAVFTTLTSGIIFAHATNPFTYGNIVVDPYHAAVTQQGDITLSKIKDLSLVDNNISRRIGWIKAATHMITNLFAYHPPTKPNSVDDIIDTIHAERFDPKKPYIISGDHFSVLYPRSLGIFYHSALDPRTARSLQDWQNRQIMYLKTTAYALDTFENAKELSTTIVPIGPSTVTLTNFFTKPSDTLYSLLYALRVLQTSDEIMVNYPFINLTTYTLSTQKASSDLLTTHFSSLQRHLHSYEAYVTDPTTGLVKKNITLSGTKDSYKHQSAFYDNVIYWKTKQLAQEVGLEPANSTELETLKQHILQEFWLEKEGYFVEDLSPEALKNKRYSSDWLISLMTGFLQPTNPQELPYFERSIAYIQKNKLDQPFPLKYETTDRTTDTYPAVRIFASNYEGRAIWSNWGMEYIKALLLTGKIKQQSTDILTAKHFLQMYRDNIIKYNGYPELYASNGLIFTDFFYHSVQQTGWIVSFEQAQALSNSITNTSN